MMMDQDFDEEEIEKLDASERAISRATYGEHVI